MPTESLSPKWLSPQTMGLDTNKSYRQNLYAHVLFARCEMTSTSASLQKIEIFEKLEIGRTMRQGGLLETWVTI